MKNKSECFLEKGSHFLSEINEVKCDISLTIQTFEQKTYYCDTDS